MELEKVIQETDVQPVDPELSHKVADIKLAGWGRTEMELAENEMPGLMSLREKYSKDKPLKGLKVMGSLHMTIQTAVLIETLSAPALSIRWISEIPRIPPPTVRGINTCEAT